MFTSHCWSSSIKWNCK